MATIPHFEPLTGVIDGVNTVFTASTAYIPGSTVIFLRGLPRVATNDDGWAETDPNTGTVTLKEAPLPDDDLQMVWLESSAAVEEVEITPVSASLDQRDTFSAKIEDMPLSGVIQDTELLSTPLDEVQELEGQITDIIELRGSLEICDV